LAKTLAENFTLTKENLAAMLALIGKAEQEKNVSATGTMMLFHLKENLKLLFDRIEGRGLDFGVVRVGGAEGLDDTMFEYAKIPKEGKTSKARAIAGMLNTIQQGAGTSSQIDIIYESENDYEYELVVRTRNF